MENTEYPPTIDTNKYPILYHYCTTSTFLSIIEKRCLWFSDVNTMNDFAEMRWAYERFIEAGNLVLDVIGYDFLDAVDKLVSEAQLRLLPTLCSFSTDGDVLSQWRAYAGDGCGVSIGLDAKKLGGLSVRIAAIEYSKEKQVQHFASFLKALHEVYQGVPQADKQKFLFEQCAYMGIDMCFLKNPAFEEEKEVRLVRAINVQREGGAWSLVDSGGTGDKVSRKKLPIRFRSADHGGIISYVEVPLRGLGDDLIREIIIGPKSRNGGNEVEMALSAAGFKGFQIKHSRATYR